AVYVIVRDIGVPDLVFLNHPDYMVEGLILRVPEILADVGIFYILLRFTGKLRYAAFYLLNPFMIYLTAAWGMYDSLMMLPLVAGFVLVSRGQNRFASVSFVISGLIKLFGFVPFGLMAIDNIAHRRFREFAVQIGIGSGLSLLTFAPYFGSSLENFYVGFVLRFLGGSGALSRSYNIIANLSGLRFAGSSPIVWLAGAIVISAFLIDRRKNKGSILKPLVLWSLVAAVSLDVFSQSQPQWLSWLIPLSILYGFITKKIGLVNFAYFMGVVGTFLSITLLQTFAYLVTGVPYALLNGLEGLPDSLLVNDITVASMLLMLLGYVFLKPTKFKVEVIALTILVYLQAYFWFSIFRVVPV
ncbi:MAG TPA: hypothetical protein VE955_11960, partial [Candidatus Dormibacteraeota bacterium]|nr:hypothetical protein [Candidatus Dormibacteraeota bacterium]